MTDYDNSGILFKNDKKSGPKHPDYKGSAKVGGTEYWMAAWIKDGEKGKFMTFAFTVKDDAPQRSESELDDSIPF